MGFLFLSIRQPPRSTRTDTLSLHDALPICHFLPPFMNPASCPRMGVFCRAQPAKANRMSEADTISASAAPGANAHAAGSLPNGGLEVISIAKSYDKRAVLSDISLHVAKGEVLGLLGPNGAGTTN